MEKCKLCGATLNPQTGNCDVCDGMKTMPALPVKSEPVKAEKPKKKKR